MQHPRKLLAAGNSSSFHISTNSCATPGKASLAGVTITADGVVADSQIGAFASDDAANRKEFREFILNHPIRRRVPAAP